MLEIGDTLNGYQVLAIRPGLRPVPEGKEETWVIVGSRSHNDGVTYVAAEVSEQSLSFREWHQGYYTGSLGTAIAKGRSLASGNQ